MHRVNHVRWRGLSRVWWIVQLHRRRRALRFRSDGDFLVTETGDSLITQSGDFLIV